MEQPDRSRQIAHDRPDTRTIGRCLYCLSAEGLTREHVNPFGLAGGLILHDASCAECSKKTAQFESRLLTDWAVFRAQNSVPTRNKRNRPKSGKIRLEDGSEIAVPIDELPVQIILPDFAETPGLFRNAKPAELKPHGLYRITRHDDAASDLLSKYGPFAIAHRDNIQDFVRLLAKIARGFVIAEYGIEGFQPFLTDLILKGDMSDIAFAIGRRPTPLADGHGHYFSTSMIGAVDGPWFGYCDIRLFHPGAPSYRVVAGYYDEQPQCRCGAQHN